MDGIAATSDTYEICYSTEDDLITNAITDLDMRFYFAIFHFFPFLLFVVIDKVVGELKEEAKSLQKCSRVPRTVASAPNSPSSTTPGSTRELVLYQMGIASESAKLSQIKAEPPLQSSPALYHIFLSFFTDISFHAQSKIESPRFKNIPLTCCRLCVRPYCATLYSVICVSPPKQRSRLYMQGFQGSTSRQFAIFQQSLLVDKASETHKLPTPRHPQPKTQDRLWKSTTQP